MTISLRCLLACAPLLLLAAPTLGAASGPVTLQAGKLQAQLDPAFPRVLQFQLGDRIIPAQLSATSTVLLNGNPADCKVTSTPMGKSQLLYALAFPAENIQVGLLATLAPDHLEIQLRDLREAGPSRIESIAFPGNALLCSTPQMSDATLAFLVWDVEYTWKPDELNWMPGGKYRQTTREEITPVAGAAPGTMDGSYAFLSAGPAACAVISSNFTNRARVTREIIKDATGASCAISVPRLEVRARPDDSPELPWIKVAITGDRNDDGKADWQDAAIALRPLLPPTPGTESVKSMVGEHIAMNFASGAQQPFLKILDNLKAFALATDFLGQRVTIKGFSSEGHDSANTDYDGNWNERAGGLDDLRTLTREAKPLNAQVGIHINTSEVYPESRRYDPAILDRNSAGKPRVGWVWLDHAHMIDQHKDFRSGTAFTSLQRMRANLPDLDYVYVDTFMNNGWPGRALSRQLHALGLPIHSEFSTAMEPAVVWSHSRGNSSRILRFLHFSTRDLFGNDPLLRGGRADTDGFMGWQNKHNFHTAVANTFSSRLPAKFLQHFELLAWAPGSSARFSGGLSVTKAGDKCTAILDGRDCITWSGNGGNEQYCLPWPPAKPAKFYVWNSAGGSREWQLPPTWDNKRLVLHKLGRDGRGPAIPVTNTNGRIALTTEAQAAYVLVPAGVAPLYTPANIAWGKGGLVADPGFNGSLAASWTPAPAGASATIEADNTGNRVLVLSGADAASVTQRIRGVKPGKSYLVQVWMEIHGQRGSGIEVRCGDKSWHKLLEATDIRHSAPNDPRTGSNFQRLQLIVDVPAGCSSLDLVLTTAASATGAIVRFDDVRIVATERAAESSRHFLWEDFEHLVAGGYGPFSCCPGERTHLSETNLPHTSDTIHGRFSLKSRDNGRVLRTVPASLNLAPNTSYRVRFLALGDGCLTAESGTTKLATLAFSPSPDGKPVTIEGTFSTGAAADTFLALYRSGKSDFIAIDDLAIDRLN